MGYCSIDHSLADVEIKLAEQSPFLPQHIVQGFHFFLTSNLTQEQLNEAFHVLKKYDLLSDAERVDRDEQILNLWRD